MRRFSQRNSLVTLSDINITPLLDLAFVLLIIFVIISPSMRSQQEHAIKLNLPQGGGPANNLQARDIRTVEISTDGVYMLDRKRVTLDHMEKELVAAYRANPNLLVSIRVDEMGRNKHSLSVIDRCTRNGITRLSFATKASSTRP